MVCEFCIVAGLSCEQEAARQLRQSPSNVILLSTPLTLLLSRLQAIHLYTTAKFKCTTLLHVMYTIAEFNHPVSICCVPSRMAGSSGSWQKSASENYAVPMRFSGIQKNGVNMTGVTASRVEACALNFCPNPFEVLSS